MMPSIAIVDVQQPSGRRFHLWLPLFLLWIPLLILAPLIFLVVLALCLVGRVSPWQAIATFWSLAWSLSGTDVRVTAEGRRVVVRVL